MSDDAKRIAAAQMMSKNLGLGVLLTLLFGGLGLLYASLFMGLIATVVEIILLILAFVTFGFGFLLLVPFHVITIVLAIISINGHNRRILSNM